MFTIALPTIAKWWEQPECLSTGEQANRGPSAQWGTPQPWQGVRCQHTLQHGWTQEATEFVIPLTQNVQKRQIHRQKAGAGGGGGSASSWVRDFFGVIKTFWNQIEMWVARRCECTKCHCAVHFKMVNFMVYEFHPSFKNGCFVGIPPNG